jgi:hypothetical protein
LEENEEVEELENTAVVVCPHQDPHQEVGLLLVVGLLLLPVVDLPLVLLTLPEPRLLMDTMLKFIKHPFTISFNYHHFYNI